MTASNVTVAQPTMTSLELVDIINEVRVANGKAKILHKNLLQKIESHPGIQPAEFSAGYIDEKGEERKVYNLPRRECDLLVMSESLALQAQVYDRLIKELGEKSARQLTEAEVKRIELDYAENCRHHPNYELGEALKKAIKMEEYDSAAELDKILDKLNFAPAAHAQGLSVETIRRQVAAQTAAKLMLGHMVRGEHEHDSPVVEVVKWARTVVKQEEAKANLLAYQKQRETRALTLAQIDAVDRGNKHRRVTKQT